VRAAANMLAVEKSPPAASSLLNQSKELCQVAFTVIKRRFISEEMLSAPKDGIRFMKIFVTDEMIRSKMASVDCHSNEGIYEIC
jgi:hypothetical protein